MDLVTEPSGNSGWKWVPRKLPWKPRTKTYNGHTLSQGSDPWPSKETSDVPVKCVWLSAEVYTWGSGSGERKCLTQPQAIYLLWLSFLEHRMGCGRKRNAKNELHRRHSSHPSSEAVLGMRGIRSALRERWLWVDKEPQQHAGDGGWGGSLRGER